jgi:hypothetical protein
MGEKDGLIQAFQDWRQAIDDDATIRSVAALAESAGHASAILDRFCSWTVAGASAVAGLLFANIESILTVFSRDQVGLLVIVLSGVVGFGLIQKLFAMRVAQIFTVVQVSREELDKVLEAHRQREDEFERKARESQIKVASQYSLEKVLEIYQSLYPKWTRFFVSKAIRTAQDDHNYVYRSLMSKVVLQHIAAAIQYVAVFAFVFLVGELL